jgi:hypothetical protein
VVLLWQRNTRLFQTNLKRIQENSAINKSMEKNSKSSGHGGARQGAGRPKGSTNKITMDNIIQNLDRHLGVSYAEQIAINYAQAINREDWSGVRDYDRVLLGKVVADKLEVESTESEDATVAKAEAFAEALRALTTVNKKKD